MANEFENDGDLGVSDGNLGPELDAQETQDNTDVQQPTVIQAGGRSFKSAEELARSYDSLQKDYSRKGSELSRLSELQKLDQVFKADPELEKRIRTAITEYKSQRSAGASPSQAAQASGVSPEIVKSIEEVRSQLLDLHMEKEMAAVKSKYSLSDEDMAEVLEEAEKLGGVALEVAYRNRYFDLQRERASAQGKAEGEKRAANKRAAGSVGPSKASLATPELPAKRGPKTQADYDAAMKRDLEQWGVI